MGGEYATICVILNIPQINDVSFGDIWNNHLWENNYDMCCPMCASSGLKRILHYGFDTNKYLMLSFVQGVTDDGILMPKTIANHPDESFRLQGDYFKCWVFT